MIFLSYITVSVTIFYIIEIASNLHPQPCQQPPFIAQPDRAIAQDFALRSLTAPPFYSLQSKRQKIQRSRF